MGGWEEEIYYSLFSIGHCYQVLNYDKAHIIEAYLKAFYYRPSRLEALYQAVRLCQEHEFYTLGYQLAKLVTHIQHSDDLLFVHHEIYNWRFLDEFAVCAVNGGHRSEVRGIIAYLIASPQTPPEQLARLQAKLQAAVDY